MNKLYALLLAFATSLATLSQAADTKAPVTIIYDTDMWGDIDDMLALAMLHTLQDRGEVKLAAVTISTDLKWCASYIDLVNTFYGHPDVPIGLVRNGVTEQRTIDAVTEQYPTIAFQKIAYVQALAER